MNTAAAAVQSNPFPGLRPFREEEEYLFFGRENQVDAMVDKLAATHFLAVVGTSGSGKSSLVNCGLRPALHGGLMARAGTAWRMAQFRPGSDPLGAMARELAEDDVLFRDYQAGGLTLAEIVDTTLRMSKLGLIDIYEQAQLGQDVNLLVVVDQFEELFRYRQLEAGQHEDVSGISEAATAFVNLLLEAKEQTTYPIYVVLTMRSDFLGDCAQFPGLAEAINAGQYLVPRMTRDERRAAISGPVGVGGAEIKPVLLTRLVNDVGDNPDQLSILQHALNRTWARWQHEGGSKGPLDLAHYEAIGTMAHALDQHAEKAYAELGTARQQQICGKLFKALTDKATDPRGVRRPTTLGTLSALADATEAEVTEVIDVFRQPSRSFLMPPAGETLAAETVIDISHESLMRVWRRLNTWADEEAQSTQIYRRLAETSVLHAEGHAGLWQDPDLQVALDWSEKEKPTAAWAERYQEGFDAAMGFLAESEASREKEVREKEAQQQRELEQAQALAMAKASRAKIMGICFLIAAFIACFAIFQYFEAEEAKKIAVNESIEAEEAKKIAVNERIEAKKSEDKALIASKVAEKAKEEAEANSKIARRLAQEANLREKAAFVKALPPKEPVKALLVAIQTTGENKEKLKEDIPQVQSSLLSVMQGAKWSKLFHAAEGLGSTKDDLSLWVLSSLDQETIVSTHILETELETEMVVHLWDGKGKFINSIRNQKPFEPVAISPDGKTIITTSHNGTVDLWSREGTIIKNLPMVSSDTDPVKAIAISADGETIVTGKKGVVEFWNLEGESLGKQMPIEDDYHVLKISPDKQRILCLNIEGEAGARLQDRTGNLTYLGDSVVSGEFSPDGQRIVTGSFDGTVQLWDREGTSAGDPLEGHEGPVFAVAFSPDGQRIFSGGIDGSVRMWNLKGESLGEPRWQSGMVFSLAISRKGIVSGTLDGHVAFWPLDNEVIGSPLESHVSHAEGAWTLTSIAVSPDGKTIVGGSADGTVRLWDRMGKSIEEPLIEFGSRGSSVKVTSVAISSNGTIVAGAEDGNVRAWEAGKPIGKPLIKFEGDDEREEPVKVTSVAISSNGTIVAGAENGNVRIWKGGKPIAEPLIKFEGDEWEEPVKVTSVAISSNGTIVAGAEDGNVQALLDGEDKPRILHESAGGLDMFFGNVKIIKSLAISSDGPKIVAGSDDGDVWLWIFKDEGERKTPRPRTLRGHAKPITSVAFILPLPKLEESESAQAARQNHTQTEGEVDGEIIVSGSADGAVRLWDLKGNSMGSPLGGGTGGNEDVTVVAFSANAHGIVTVSRDDKRVRLWRIGEQDTWLQEACKMLLNHHVLVDLDNDIAQEIAYELGHGIVENAGETCLKHVKQGDWNDSQKAAFLVRQGMALALRAEASDVDKAVVKFRAARNLDPNIIRDLMTDSDDQNPETIAHRLAAPAKAKARVDEGAERARQGDIEGAIAAFKEARKLDKDVILDQRTEDDNQDPQAVASRLAARAKVEAARTQVDLGAERARQGDIEGAIAAFKEARKLDKDVILDQRTEDDNQDPQAVASRLAARAKVEAARAQVDLGYRLTQEGDIDKALQAYAKAQELDPKLATDSPSQLVARAKVDQGAERARQGDIKGAIAAFEEARKLDKDVILDEWTEGDNQDPQAVASRLSARVKVDQGAERARQGDIEGAIAAFKEARKLDKDVILDQRTEDDNQDPQAVASRLEARAQVDIGYRLTQEGDIDKALQAYAKAQELDPKLATDSPSQLVARAKVDLGAERARQGDIEGAIAAFEEARKLDEDVILDDEWTEGDNQDPQAVASRLEARANARAKVDLGAERARQGDIEGAIAAFEEAQKLDPSLKKDASFWDGVGWSFSLSGHGAEGLVAGEKAVKFAAKDDPDLAYYRETRGLARALTDDTPGAIKDFEAAIAANLWGEEYKAKRQQWVDALRKGENPFTPEYLRKLRNE